MKRMLAYAGLLLALSTAAMAKDVVVVEQFQPLENCKVDGGTLQNIRNRVLDAVLNSRKFEVVERAQLKTVLKEQALVDAGLTEGKAPESNKLKAAGHVMYGTVIRYGTERFAIGAIKAFRADVEIQLRFADAESGRIRAVKTVRGVGVRSAVLVAGDERLTDDALNAAIASAARDAANSLVELAFPTTVLAVNSRFVTVNLTAEQCAEGDVFEVFELGEELTDPKTGDSLGFDEDLIGRVVVSRPGPKVTKCVVAEGTKLEDVAKGMVLRRVSQETVEQGSVAPVRSLRNLR